MVGQITRDKTAHEKTVNASANPFRGRNKKLVMVRTPMRQPNSTKGIKEENFAFPPNQCGVIVMRQTHSG